MGASEFCTEAKGKTPQEAFARAIEKAQYDHGHAGYTGTIAEKTEFKLVHVPSGWQGTARDYAESLMEDDDDAAGVQDKWGPCGCIEIGNGEYLFFGWASS